MRLGVAIGGLALAGGLSVFLLMPVFDPETFRRGVEHSVGPGISLSFSGPATAVVVLLLAVQFAALLAAVWCVWRMFGEFAREEPLTPQSAAWMQRASIGFLVLVIVSALARPGVVLALTLANPPGQRAFAISFGSADIFALLIAAIMYMTSRVIALAAEIRDDQREII
ncbi:MAG: DUF2975 domain-containing protein [Rhizobiaceae bacterium]|nr:DUF2975 domain-containing protein [Rhizobiaceae bacterium]